MSRTVNKSRKTNYYKSKQKILIFCEGAKTEPNYFNGFKDEIEINAIYRNMIEIHPVEEGTLKVLEKARRFIKLNKIEKALVWCVYDKDDFSDDDFNNVIVEMDKLNKKDNNIQYNAAWSNQCIEFWFILHFCNYQSDNHRNEYLKYLKKKFKELNLGTYNKNDDKIFNILLEHGDPKMARKFAKRKIDESLGLKPSEIAPATTVYKLVEQLSYYLPEDKRAMFI